MDNGFVNLPSKLKLKEVVDANFIIKGNLEEQSEELKARYLLAHSKIVDKGI